MAHLGARVGVTMTHAAVGGWSAVLALIGAVSLAGVASKTVVPTPEIRSEIVAESDVPVPYRAPVNAPIRDPFRLENGRYGAGNRGLEYATKEGDTVRSIGSGVVSYAGTVAGSRHVTVQHLDGLRSSYSHLGSMSVVAGQSVRLGERVGEAGRMFFHLGVRDGDQYIDPEQLFDSTPGPSEPRLIPQRSFGR